ncbi:MAG TPA: carbohydrate-binding family 9-like protein [Candidatus Acidoferrales bacterium]|nr:carbohydrate-binding family 9-like protein [Candidatus Acidoferrales bacterium]
MRLLTLAFVAFSLLLAYAADGPGILTSSRAERDVSADTDPNSPFWRGAPAVVAASDSYGREVPGHRTEVRSRWTGSSLYFLFTCPYEQLHLKPAPETVKETNQLWKWDVAEVFVGSDFQNIRRYKEFEVSPQGEWVDLDIDLDQPHHEDGWTWNSGFQSAARIDAASRVWYCFMRIPYSAIDSRPPAAGNELRVNLYRSQGPPGAHKAIAWRPTGKATFHAPESFGILKLAP